MAIPSHRSLDSARRTVGVISDTHGLLRPEALTALAGADIIIHAGDIGRIEVLQGLESIAPVYAVRGNVDRDVWASEIPLTQSISVGHARIYVIHRLRALDVDAKAAGICVVVFGHSHKPTLQERDGVLFFNPGSAGPRRFRLPVGVGRLLIDGDGVRAELMRLPV